MHSHCTSYSFKPTKGSGIFLRFSSSECTLVGNFEVSIHSSLTVSPVFCVNFHPLSTWIVRDEDKEVVVAGASEVAIGMAWSISAMVVTLGLCSEAAVDSKPLCLTLSIGEASGEDEEAVFEDGL